MSYPPASRPSRSAARPIARPATHSRSHSRSHLSAQGRLAQRRLSAKQSSSAASQPLISNHQRKVLWAGGAITLLAMATILPTQVSSQAIPSSSCEQVIKSGAEISRGQISQLLTFPEGTRKTAIRQALDAPYCTLPTAETAETAEEGDSIGIEREAYPLAFDPEAWVVLSYESGEYSGYDFVFKP